MNRFLPSSVLIVDDSYLQQQYGASLCRQLGIEHILFAGDGVHAIEILQKSDRTPDCMIIDLEMPNMDGVELLQEITRLNIGIEVLIASSRENALLSTVETMSKSMGISFLGALQKPLSVDGLNKALKNFGHQHLTAKSQFSDLQSLESIREGIRKGEFICHFQPKLSVSNLELKGVEALARWNSPQYGLLYPNSFIETIDQDDLLMKEFTLSMLDNLLLHMKQWQGKVSGLTVSLNMSARSLADLNFIKEITSRVESSGIDTQSIIFEVTETSMLNDLATSLGTLARLRLKGFGLSIDDYGTGFSSMQQLVNIPATELKIDRSFVHESHQRHSLRIMLENTVDMARKLNISVVAEGVESVEEWKVLEEIGCDLVQGYFVGKPMAGEKIIDWVSGDLKNFCKKLSGATGFN